MALKSGSVADFNNSMAEAIQQAFINEWPTIMKGDAPPPSDQMKLLFIAVAKGVVQHLTAHAEAFVVKPQTELDYKFDVEIKGS